MNQHIETEETKPTAEPEPAPPAKKRRGFAAMDPSKVREYAKRGGVAVHRKGKAHRFTSEEARAAGQKGGQAFHRSRGRKIMTGPETDGTPQSS